MICLLIMDTQSLTMIEELLSFFHLWTREVEDKKEDDKQGNADATDESRGQNPEP